MNFLARLDVALRGEALRLINLMYSHCLIRSRVPLRPEALAMWMDRLVSYEVCVLLLLFTRQFNTLQDQIIGIANLGDLQEGDLDAHLLYFGIHRAEIRAFIGLFATADWPTRFPQYTLQFQSELGELTSAVRDSVTLPNANGDPLAAEARSVSFDGARIRLIARRNEGVLNNDALTRCLFRLNNMFIATFEQQAVAYALPPINDTCYHHRAPQQLPAQQQPHEDVVDISSDSDEDAQQRHRYLRRSLRRLGGVEDQTDINDALPISRARSGLRGHRRGSGRARGRGRSHARSM